MPHFGDHSYAVLMRGEKEMNGETATSLCVRENNSGSSEWSVMKYLCCSSPEHTGTLVNPRPNGVASIVT